MSKPKLEFIPLSAIIESPNNPRQYFDPQKMTDLVASMKAHGQLTPALVRPKGKKFELAAGHRRFRAAPRAELEGLECIVRELSEVEFIEILTIENDEREDVHALEQAAGYKLLMTSAGYDVAKIAARLQRSHDFVYDRLSLLQLTPALKKHFLEDHFSLGHAVILSKLTVEQQEQLNDVGSASNGRFQGDESGLWRMDYALFAEEDEQAGRWPYQPHSVGELQKWINDHIRFRPEEVQLETEYPETEAMLVAAAEAGTPVYHITSGYNVGRDARDPNRRTYGERSWRRADGLEKSETCELSGVGLFVDGNERGTAIGVCVRRDKCLVHWKAEVNAAAKRQRAREKEHVGEVLRGGRASDPKPKDAFTVATEARDQEVLEAYVTELFAAARRHVGGAAASAYGAGGSVGRFMLDSLFEGNNDFYGKVDKKKVGTAAVDLVKFLALEILERMEDDSYYDDEDLVGHLKPLGLDLKAAKAKAEAAVPPVGALPAKKETPAKGKKPAAAAGSLDHWESLDD